MPEPARMNRVPVSPKVVQWARERAHLDMEGLVGRFPKLPQWERGGGAADVQAIARLCQGNPCSLRLPVPAPTGHRPLAQG